MPYKMQWARLIKDEVSTLTLQLNELQQRVEKLEAQRMGEQSTDQQPVSHEDLDPKIGMLETQVNNFWRPLVYTANRLGR